ncbi:MAG: type 1 glutamine amidotransferase [Rudaea sp.]|nr:type 1 glutamine amidotransferase [Rudaea sp.]
MDGSTLQYTRIAIVATDGFEQSELAGTKRTLEKAAASVDVIAPAGTAIRGWNKQDWGDEIRVDAKLDKADAGDCDAIGFPGGLINGVVNPDTLRPDRRAGDFIRQFAAKGKPIAAICHGPQVLIEADLVRGRQLTSWPSLQTDLKNAGAQWHDRGAVEDGDLIASREPDDIPAFVAALIARRTPSAQQQRNPSQVFKRT